MIGHPVLSLHKPLVIKCLPCLQGTHPSLRGSSKALATVTSIIDGTGSVGAAIGPFLAGAIHGLDKTFYMLMAADVCALLASSVSCIT